jgi:hypothetical protein
MRQSGIKIKSYKQGLKEKRKFLYLDDLMNKDFEDMKKCYMKPD